MRSGSTLQYQLTQTLVETLNKGVGWGWLPSLKNRNYLFEKATEKDKDTYYIVKIHGYSPAHETLINQDKGRAIYVYRDLRDVVTSFMSWKNCSFDAVIREQWIDKVIRDSKNWESVAGIYSSQYEVLMDNLPEEVLGIAQYLGLSISLEVAQEVAEKCSIKQQKKTAQLMQSQQQKIDPQNILHYNHISSGQSKRWEKELSAPKVAYIEQKAGNWLQAHGYTLAYPNSVQRNFLVAQANMQLLVSNSIFQGKRFKSRVDKYFSQSESPG